MDKQTNETDKSESIEQSIVTNWFSQLENNYAAQLKLINSNVKDWPLMSSPMLVIYASLVYLIVIKLAILLMRNSNGFKLKLVVFLYNLVLIGANLLIIGRIVYLKYLANDFGLCTVIQSVGSPYAKQMNKIIWWFFVLKGVEFCDTILLVLRKKTHQINFLHVYTHATMFPVWWFCTAFQANGTTAIAALLNSLIHVLMHFYYAVSILGPSFQKLIRWKKYLILFQILQYCILITLCSLLLYNGCDHTSDYFFWYGIYYSLTHLTFIYYFYSNSYYKIMSKQFDMNSASIHAKKHSISNGNSSFRIQATRRRPLRNDL